MRLLLYAADHNQGLAEIGLRVPGWMRQRYEHLPLAQLSLPHIIFHDRVATWKRVLVPQSLKDPLGTVSLFSRPSVVVS
jgi:hypothetical protein